MESEKSSLHLSTSCHPSFISLVSGFLSLYIKTVDPLITQAIALPCQGSVNSNACCLCNRAVIFF